MAERGRETLHPRLEEISEHLAETRAAVLTAVHDVPPARRDVRPTPDRWSVGEILEHLAKVETGVARLVAKRAAEARASGLALETETSSVLGKFDASRIPARDAGLQSPPMVAPASGVNTADAIGALGSSRAALREAMTAANGLALGQIVHPHPVVGTIDLYQWLVFVAVHEARHAEQIREIR